MHLPHLVSAGDFIDLYFKIRQKSYKTLVSKLGFSEKSRTRAKWNAAVSASDFWMIPLVRKRWNKIISGDENTGYENYVNGKYLSGKSGLKMLSVGCGTGGRERVFAGFESIESIDAIDMAELQLEEARNLAKEQNINKINYFTADFLSYPFPENHYDIILFHSSLHHFKTIERLLPERILPLLKDDGILVIHEYAGPNRLQWTQDQLDEVNRLLNTIPAKYRHRYGSNAVKNKVYRPGLLRMKLIDPSEAVDSAAIIPALHKYCKTLEEKPLGWNIIHLLLKDISHHFVEPDATASDILEKLFIAEDNFTKITGQSDAVFGVWKKI